MHSDIKLKILKHKIMDVILLSLLSEWLLPLMCYFILQAIVIKEMYILIFEMLMVIIAMSKILFNNRETNLILLDLKNIS